MGFTYCLLSLQTRFQVTLRLYAREFKIAVNGRLVVLVKGEAPISCRDLKSRSYETHNGSSALRAEISRCIKW
jgi:hypothetical protein